MSDILTYANTAVIILFLIAGGWVKLRDYFKAKAQEKADAIEAEVQKRLAEKAAATTAS